MAIIFKAIVLICFLFSDSYALPYFNAYVEKVNDQFFDGDQLSRTKVNEFRDHLVRRRSEIYNMLYREEHLLKKKNEINTEKKVQENKTIKNFDLLLSWVDELDENKSKGELFSEISQILEMDLAIKSEIDPKNDPIQFLRHVKAFGEQIKISKDEISPYGEASNLINPDTGEFFSKNEIEGLKENNVDISKFDPPADNGVVFPMGDISKVDINEVYGEGKDFLHEGLKTEWPKNNIAYFDKVGKTQLKPKILIYTKNKEGKKKRRYKLKLSNKIHSEPTSAALSSALGMPVDISRYVKSFKMKIGNMTFDQLKLDWNEYYSKYKLEKYVESFGSDSDGNYIIFKEGMLEAKYDENDLNRVGPWYWGQVDHKGRREFRGLLLFNIWVHNTDLKEAENNKLVHRVINNKKQFFYLQHDLGFGFGHYFRERPMDFRWKIIEHDNDKEIEFNFRSFQPNSGFEHVTFSDAKWMVRKIAQLTKKQITDAVKLGHWPSEEPHNYSKLLVEKLANRRNDLVKSFGLLGEILPNGEEIALLEVDKSIEDSTEYARRAIPGLTTSFRAEIVDRVIDPIMKAIENFSVDAFITSLGRISRVSIDPGWVGLDSGFISQIIVKIKRSIVENPRPEEINESYIVRDDYEIGFRLGVGAIVSGDVSFVKKFSLIFTTKTNKKARRHKRYIFKVAKPYRELLPELPKKHVLISESFLQGRGRIKLNGGGPISLGIQGSSSIIGLSRNIIANNGKDKISIYEDTSIFDRLGFRFYTKLPLVKIPHLKMRSDDGEVTRQIYDVDINSLPLEARALDLVIRENDFSEIKKYAKVNKIENDFLEKYFGIDIFGFRTYRSRFRLDDMKLFVSDENNDFIEIGQHFDTNIKKENRWSFFNNGEEHNRRIRISTEYENDKMIRPFVELNFTQIDKNVTTKEMNKGYLKFIDGVAGRKNFIGFTPDDHSVRDTWGPLNFHVRIQYFKEGIKKLLSTKKSTFIRLLAKNLNLSFKDLSYYMQKMTIGPHGRDVRASYLGISYSVKELTKRFNMFFDRLSYAIGLDNLEDKLKEMIYALDKVSFQKGHSYYPLLLNVINQVVGEENLFFNSRIVVPREWENKLPGRVNPYNEIGKERSYSNRETLFFGLQDALEIYFLFLRGDIPEIYN